MTIINQKTIEESNWEFFNLTFDLEKEWRKSLPRFTDKELLQIFPEAKAIIPEKIAEWVEERNEILDTIKKKLTLIKHRVSDASSQWFWREWVKVSDGEELLKTDNHIARLKRLLVVTRRWGPKGRITEEKIQQVLRTPIENVVNQCIQLRKSGRNLVGLCPFHNEKCPSFFIYQETNSFYCYGCQKGGNVITFVEKFYNFSFKETVEFLLNNF